MQSPFPPLFIFLLITAPAQADTTNGVVVTKSASQQVSIGSPETFTGEVHVTSRFQRAAPARIGGGDVTFDAKARTAWHTHPLGQTLIVTEGEGWVQHWGGKAQAIKPGDVVWIPPNVKHWHGATSHSRMRHIAISESLNGKSVEWLEHVTDDQYPADTSN
jgi:quercetin dioxygenase-like cupin family protein